MKYGQSDVRNILERASARETAARVAVGAVARRFLEEFGVEVHSHTVAIGGIEAMVTGEPAWQAVEESALRCADGEAERRMLDAIDIARNEGDSLGGVTEVRATGVPIGLGSHVQWDQRLSGLLAQAVMSIPSVKGVETGEGFDLAARRGSESQDVILPADQWDGRPWRRASNHAGGLEGGMTNGEPVVIRAALEADIDPCASAGVGRPGDGRKRRSALRAFRRLHRSRCGCDRRSNGRHRPRGRNARQVRR